MKIKLYYQNKALGEAWREQFGRSEQVVIIEGSILDTDCDAIVSPANSFGFMDGGLDWHLSEHFGWDFQDAVQERIKQRPIKELLVGEALILSTGANQIPWMIVAPTMRVPMHIKTSINAYLALKAILSSTLTHTDNPAIHSIAIPGLGTGVGRLSPQNCAIQMFAAYTEILENHFKYPTDFKAAQKNQLNLNDQGLIYD